MRKKTKDEVGRIAREECEKGIEYHKVCYHYNLVTKDELNKRLAQLEKFLDIHWVSEKTKTVPAHYDPNIEIRGYTETPKKKGG